MTGLYQEKDLWSIPGNHWPYCGRVLRADQNWIPNQTQQSRHIPALKNLQKTKLNPKGTWYEHDPKTTQTLVTEKHNRNITILHVGYANTDTTDRSWDKSQQTRHCNQEQTGKKLPPLLSHVLIGTRYLPSGCPWILQIPEFRDSCGKTYLAVRPFSLYKRAWIW